MDLRLDGKVALVTGGSRGIGKAIAREMKAAGAEVLITARKPAELEAAAREIGEGTRWLAGNAGDPSHAEAAVALAIGEFGRLDVLVNNAATNPYAGSLIDADLPRFDKTWEVNLRGPFLWTQQAWRQWMKEQGGAVIHLASIGGLQPAPMLGVYNITKAALIHMTKQMAVELAPKVRVNAIAPALIKTDFARVLWEGGGDSRIAASYPLKRLGEPEDISAAALYLAAEQSSWITGHTLVLDGGSTLSFGF